MKTLGLTGLLAVSFACAPKVNVEVIHPATVSVAPHVRTLALLHIQEPTGNAPGAAIDALFDFLDQSPRFDVVMLEAESVLNPAEAQHVAGQVGVDAIVTLTSLTFASSVTVDVREPANATRVDGRLVQCMSANCADESRPRFLAKRTTEVFTTWSLYQPQGERWVTDSQTSSHTVSHTGAGLSEDESITALVDEQASVLQVAQEVGRRYAGQIVPTYQSVDRPYYIGHTTMLKDAHKLVKREQWAKAQRDYESLATHLDQAVRGKALHNLAVVYEAHGDLDRAHEMAQNATSIFPTSRTRRYARDLQRRVDGQGSTQGSDVWLHD